MSNPYLIISSDCHAGPETPDYRDFLDPEYREPFDESLKERERLIAENKLASPISMGGDEDFQEEWFGHDEGEESLHEGGLRCGWDAPKRDKELDNDGVTAEVIFPGPDAATGSMGAPFGAGLVLGILPAAVAMLLTDGSFNGEKGHRLLGAVSQVAPEHHRLCRWGLESAAGMQQTQFMATDSVSVLKHGVQLGRETWQVFLKGLRR
jgi:hypothetical protein